MAIVKGLGGSTLNLGGATGGWTGQEGAMYGMRDPDTQDQLANQRLGFGSQERIANIGAEASKYPALLQQGRFDRVFPWLQGQMGSINSQMAKAGGQSGPSPEISVGGVLNPQQIQQQVNSMKAGNQQAGASQMAGQTQSLAGRGFGSNSPLLAALHGQTQASTLGQNVGGERDIRLGAAKENAGQLLSSQTARENQFANRQREDIERRKPYFSMQNTLLSSLAGLV